MNPYFKLSTCLLAIFLLIVVDLNAQKNESDKFGSTARSVFGEVGGPGLLSINYDQRFKGQRGLGIRLGIGLAGIIPSKGGVLAFPIGLNYLQGSKGNYLEYGAGISPITLNDGTPIISNYISSSIGFLNIGYRYQPIKNGFTFRAFACPIFTNTSFYPWYGGISMGYKF